MDELTDDLEFEPLFDYHRVQPTFINSIDDDLSDTEKALDVSPPKRFKKAGSDVCVDVKPMKPIVCDDNDEEDWLPPPPKMLNGGRKSEQEDSTIKALRLKKQELASFAESAEDVLREVEESARKQVTSSLQASLGSEDEVKVSKPTDDRKKIVISIQDKEGPHKYRVYMEEKLERIFKVYADKVKVDLGKLVFSFDGDKISGAVTPEGLGMEDDDIIEVNTKKS
ncbi:hypothetical protein ACHQM5_009616 [Ranunculus cassubicifolius]